MRDDRKALHPENSYQLINDAALAYRYGERSFNSLLQLRLFPGNPPKREYSIRCPHGEMSKVGALHLCYVGDIHLPVVRGVCLMTWLTAALDESTSIRDMHRLRDWAKRVCQGKFFSAGNPPMGVVSILRGLTALDSNDQARARYLNGFYQINWDKLFSIKTPESAMIQVLPSKPQADKPFYIEELRP